ncbi:MAG: hypothetical protein EA373_03025 [Oceanospirillales bacterium]|nr:MAG: hypothetical protein EA373_03025 [Oceanospirillales bacterium]
MSSVPKVTRALLNAPLPSIIERLGISIAQAQNALDQNSIALAQEMASTEVEIGDNSYNLLTLGFQPSFYAFTEATVEAKLSFSMMESTEFGIKAGAHAGGVAGPVMFGASIEASYARKFSVSANGMSSIAARLVSLPAPDVFTQLLKQHYEKPVN